ncbi:MAG: bifunctional glycosyltransferase family 2/GtrA family protein [Leptospiraceae bacterium]|nr:bifunctional glycosyltransferase family 2/GtrA family protein [Leptospiraceae bacterium]
MLLRKFTLRFLAPSASKIQIDPSRMIPYLNAGWRSGVLSSLQTGRIGPEMDGLIFLSAAAVPELSLVKPGAVLMYETLDFTTHERSHCVSALQKEGYQDIVEIHYGFFLAIICPLLALPAIRRAVFQSGSRFYLFSLYPILYLETLLLPYVHFIFGLSSIILAKAPAKVLEANCDLSVVIPAFNESKRIAANLGRIDEYFKQNKISCELIVVNDGSSDNTSQIVKQTVPQANIVELFVNQGKGAAVREGIRASLGRQILVADADGATPVEEFARLVTAMGSNFDIGIGSRYLDDSLVKRKQSVSRIILSRIGNLVIRTLTGLRFKDTQCGFKLFDRKAALYSFEGMRIKRFGYDFDILRRAQNGGYRIVEVPVEWHDQDGSTVRRIDIIQVFLSLIKLRFDYLLRFGLVGIANTLVDYSIHFLVLIPLLGFGNDAQQLWFQAFSFIVANIFSYLFNSSFTFRKHGDYWKFFLVSILVFIATMGTFRFFQLVIGVHNQLWLAIVKLCIIPVSFLVNYIGYKLLVYKIRD